METLREPENFINVLPAAIFQNVVFVPNTYATNINEKKLIGTFIWLTISGIVTFVVGGMKRDKFPLLKLLNIKLSSRILIITIILLSIANILFPQFLIWPSMVMLLAIFIIISLIYYNRAYEIKNVGESIDRAKEFIYFSTEDAPVHALTAFYEKDWVNKAPVATKQQVNFLFTVRLLI